jgi:hypothetical protein
MNWKVKKNLSNKNAVCGKKIIIVEKSMKPRYDENGYLMMGVKEFLLDANSLLI